MSEATENIEKSSSENNVPPVKKKSFFGRFIKWIFIAFVIILLLITGLFIFIQTDTFDKIALDFVLNKINSSIEAKDGKDSRISAESLEGNILTGFRLKNGSIRVKSDTLIKFSSIEAKYNIFALLKHEISVVSLTIKQPQINLTKVKDRNDSLKWNLNYFFSSDEIDEDTSKSEFDWGIIADNIQIENGSVRILEDKNTNLPVRDIIMMNRDTFDISYFDMNNLNLKLSARYFPDIKQADIKNLSFKTNSDFNINSFSLKAILNEKDSIVNVKDLSLITDKSDIRINEIEMNHTDPLKGIDYEKFKGNKTKIDLSIKNINFDDLKYFLPELYFLDSTVALDFAAEGEYEDLNISKLELITPNSNYSFTGKVKNLEHPEDIYFDITGRNLEINPIDTKLVVPGLDIPDYSHLGRVSIPYLTYKGVPENFISDFDIKSNAGNVSGNMALDISQDIPKYKGNITLDNLNIGKIVKDRKLESSVNGKFSVDASDFDYRKATGKLDYSLNRTKIYGFNISKSEGRLNFNHGNTGLNLNIASDAVTAKLEGRVNISNLKNISYDVKGNVSGLNIAAFTKDNSQKSNLNFTMDVKGSGINPDEMTGSYKIGMNPSAYSDINIPQMPLDVKIDKNGFIKDVTLNSDFADLSMKGTFQFSSFIEIISANIKDISNDINSKYFPDSVNSSDVAVTSLNTGCSNLNVDYKINIKDLTPLYSFIGNDSIHFKGKISGIISDSCGLFNLISKADIAHFDIKDSLLRTDTANADIFIKNDLNEKNLSAFSADINLLADKLIVSSFPIDSSKVKFSYSLDKNNFLISGKRDSTIRLFTKGMIRDSMVVVFDTLFASYEEFKFRNNKELILKYNKGDSSASISFRQFALNSLRQKFTFKGDYSFNDSSSINISADNIKLSLYQKLLNPDIDTNNIVNGNIRRLEIKYNGTFENPFIKLEANSDVLEVGGTKIGRLDAIVGFSNNEFTPDISFNNVNNSGSFRLKGLLPFINPLGSENTDSLSRMKILGDKTVDLNAVANNFQLKVLQQLLPYTSGLEGILDGKINLIGTSGNPVLTGNMNVNSGKFLITLTKMRYNFNAALATRDNRILINNSKIFIPQEPDKFISASGYIDLSNLELNDIDLQMSGDVKAFDKKNGQTELGISGDLWVGSGNPQLKIKGNHDGIKLTGNLVLIKGNIVFNPFVQEAYNIYSDDFNYGVIIDSLKSETEPDGKLLLQRLDSDVVYTNLNLNPFQKILYANNNTNLRKRAIKQSSSLFIYNLYVSTQGNVFLKFIVNERSQQEFFGEIKTDLYVDNKDNNQISGRGVVNLGNNCYYKFFRKFDATGKATFNGPISNPELNISASYKGYVTEGTSSSGQQNIQDVIINLDVSGYVSNPALTVSLERGSNKESGSNATSDAISFLLFGKFKDQLSFDQSTSLGANIGASYLSTFVSSSIENILPWIINTNINYVDSEGGNIASNADIRFTAAIGDAIVRFGGQIFKGIANTDIIIDYPLNKLLKVNSLSNNLFIRLEKVYDPFSESNDVSNSSGTRSGAMIFYKIKY